MVLLLENIIYLQQYICLYYILRIIGDKPFIVEVGEIESVDIDEAEDFMIADAIYNYQLQKK